LAEFSQLPGNSHNLLPGQDTSVAKKRSQTNNFISAVLFSGRRLQRFAFSSCFEHKLILDQLKTKKRQQASKCSQALSKHYKLSISSYLRSPLES
jgi:hypothetical protein